MPNFPRIAIGCFQENTNHRAAAWSVMAWLARCGLQVQPYLPQSNFAEPVAAHLTGLEQRHLDSWQMPQSLCREMFAFGAAHADLAIVEGRFDDEGRGSGSLSRLCRWLSIPRIAVLDASQPWSCDAPRRLREFDAVFLDRVPDAGAAARWSVELESLHDLRVVGWLPQMAPLRAMLDQVAEGAVPDGNLGPALAQVVDRRLRGDRLLQLAHSAPELPIPQPPPLAAQASTIALAYDEAFNCYFPDTLDRMEAAGARIRTFSPLRNESLPKDADVVVFGCGRIAPFAEPLSQNHCMHHSLMEHKRAGKRIYAEGAGAAFLCRHLVLPTGRRFAMSGLLPANAQLRMVRDAMQPVETRWRSPLWAGNASTRIRGYRNCRWQFSVDGDESIACDDPLRLDTIAEGKVIASRIHVNFAAHPVLLHDFICSDLLPQCGSV